MSLSFLIAIHTIQVLVFQFLATNRLSRLAFNQSVARNRDWVRENHDQIKGYAPKFQWFHYLLGAVLLGALTYAAMERSLEVVKLVKNISVWALLIQVLGIDMVKTKRLEKIIPATEKRSASLAPRGLSNYFSAVTVYTTVGLYIALSVVTAIFYYQGDLVGKDLYQVSFLLICVFGLFFPLTYYVCNRIPLKGSASASQMYRDAEVLIMKVCIGAFGVAAILKLVMVQYHSEFLANTEDLVRFMIILVPISAFSWFCLNKNFTHLMKKDYLANDVDAQ